MGIIPPVHRSLRMLPTLGSLLASIPAEYTRIWQSYRGTLAHVGLQRVP